MLHLVNFSSIFFFSYTISCFRWYFNNVTQIYYVKIERIVNFTVFYDRQNNSLDKIVERKSYCIKLMDFSRGSNQTFSIGFLKIGCVESLIVFTELFNSIFVCTNLRIKQKLRTIKQLLNRPIFFFFTRLKTDLKNRNLKLKANHNILFSQSLATQLFFLFLNLL